MNSKIDGITLKRMLISGANELDNKKEILNSLNVFPVPDGDTGTNMSLTVLSAAKEIQKATEFDVYTIAKAASNGSLRGARGNSGVILSQLYRGFAKGLKGKREATVEDLALSLRYAKETAYKAVMKPKEGTILTMSTEIANRAEELVTVVNDVEELLVNLIEHGKIILEKTTDMLPVLKEAGVVDSGAKGLLTILEGALIGLRSDVDVEINSYKEAKEEVVTSGNFNANVEIEFQYCTEFFVNMPSANEEVEDILRDKLSKIGDSIVVVADETFVKIHVHTNNPDKALGHALKFGELDNIKIENMKTQHTNLVGGVMKEEIAPKEKGPKKDLGIVAVAQGSGLVEILEGLGADYVINGGQSMNPSTDDILNAIEEVNSDNIILLPNNSNIFLACEQAKKMNKERNIHVVYTRTVQQGIASLINYMPSENFEDVKDSIDNAFGEIKSGEITFAVRDTNNNGIEIKKDDFLYIEDSEIKFANQDLKEGTIKFIESMITEDNIVTIYYGEDSTLEDATEIANAVMEKFEDCTVEVHEGAQPLYYYLISVEE